mmetsp:Transcript_13803/g.34691  ORF Transcript_13803/g.34691 Transcript_13803/m.34691 type:complete len:305 (+) Transcript_13803:66-980(+)|eukprot:CAMPEP_0183438468 /NCGR_PEP_ID=MMETSP0370-20130417/77401_1 /TAXON_ID=268820 /ORGANISM="Peridinium aciculiferum, Strain PAER-2" /LENGTH=304 /DNA_ID=CAMNT_0025626695 /DNA_START=57 /DNA_END=971 /DNA_ORIENTATION=+
MLRFWDVPRPLARSSFRGRLPLAAPPRGFCSPSSSDAVIVERVGAEGRIAIIRLNRPDKLNAMTTELGDAFAEVVAKLNRDDAQGLGAVVITGSGKAFSAGGDLQFLQDRHTDTPSRNAPIMRTFYQRFLCVRSLPVPVIAAINGPAIGAGLCFALACDVRIAAPKAKMGLTFTALGLHPGMGATHFLPSIVGPQVAAELLLTGKVISGEEAAQCGLVARTAEDPLAAAIESAAAMAAAGPVAVRTTVRSLRMRQDVGLDQALQREADAQAQCYASLDYRDGVEAIAEKRKPNFAQFEHYREQA